MNISSIKNPLLLILLSALFSCTGTITFNGAKTIENQTYDKPVVVNGELVGNKVNFKALTVNGKLELKDAVVRGKLKVSGSADLDRVILLEDAEISGNLMLKDSTTKDITIRSKKQVPEALLIGKVHIDGDLEFSKNEGLVTLSPETTITEGIENGKIKNKESKAKTGPIINGSQQ